ncbi:hypothetical protein VTJ83DRAFT_6921 [Remersonia thermophila]|uniref:Uncharacterized protein n=1 Tax=Remersonia thermophila TaxID=72144 RepID=A0ABR4D7K1_9PEZI
MLNEKGMRSSLQVAPLAVHKTRSSSSLAASASADTIDSQITPPATPNEPQDNGYVAPFANPVFHNFLRALYPFHPDYVASESTVTLPLSAGDIVLVHSIHTNGWADGTQLADGSRGWLPTNYCAAYNPVEMSCLLKALLNFWDLMRSTTLNDSEIFGNQEFMKGIIAGVRYLLDRAGCLTKESPVLQRNDRLRRSRKSLLSELTSLVKTSKRLQDAQRTLGGGGGGSDDDAAADDDDEAINDLVDEMILKAFRIITKGVSFLDLVEEDRSMRLPTLTIPCGAAADTRLAEHGSLSRPASFAPGNAAGRPESRSSCLSSGYLQQGADARRLSQSSLAQTNRLSAISRRVSLVGVPSSSRPHNLVSERLNACHDTFLSHLGSFIGRLQLHAHSRPSLAVAVRQSATSGGDLLVVVDVVCAHSPIRSDAVEQARAAMYHQIRDLVSAARDVLHSAEPGMEDEAIVPHDNGRLLCAATGCVKATGESVAKTRLLIERIGDFEYDFGSGSLGILAEDFGLSDLADIPAEDRPEHRRADLASISESTVSETPTASTAPSVAEDPAEARSRSLSLDKPLPDLPRPDSPVMEEPPAPAQSQSPRDAADAGRASAVSSVSSLRPDLPPLPKISTTSLPGEDYDPARPSAAHEDAEYSSFRSETLTATSAGSARTYLSRDSESSLPSQTSTRASTPDAAQTPKTQPSLSSLSSSQAPTEDDEMEDKMLEKTYAHELVFNKEGQLTGGTLPALVERLTAHGSTPDALFVSTFYLTFRLFCTPVSLTEALIHRFDYVGDAPHIATPVRLRTYNVFKGWLESHWRDESDRPALALIRDFAENKLAAALPGPGQRLLELADKVAVADGTLVPRLVSSMAKTAASVTLAPADAPPPAPSLTRSQAHALASWKSGGAAPSVLDFDPLEIARQLTLMQMAIFCAITPDELLGAKWTKDKTGTEAPNVKAMSAFTTSLTNMVIETILQHDEVKKRAVAIKAWIKIAHQCSLLHNYDALTAIVCALTVTSIQRLKMTWDLVSVKRKEMLNGLEAVVHVSSNYKALRALLHDRVPPCLPFIGMFLTDLTFVDAGNPSTRTTSTGLTVINFDKHMRTAKCIAELLRFQIPYRLAEVPDLQDLLSAQLEQAQEQEKAVANAQAAQFRKSKMLEPGDAQLQQLRNPVDGTLGGGMFSWMRGGNANNNHNAFPAQI